MGLSPMLHCQASGGLPNLLSPTQHEEGHFNQGAPRPTTKVHPSRAWLPCPSTCLTFQSSHHLCFQDFSFFFCPFSLVFKYSIDKWKKKKRKPLLEPHFHLWLPPVSHLPVTAKLSKKLSAPLFPLLTSLSFLNPIPSATARPQPPERPQWLSLRSVTTP